MPEAIVKVNLKIIHQLLKLPDNVKLLRVRQSWHDERSDLFEILISSPDIEPALPGNKLLETTIEVHTVGCQRHGCTHIIGSTIKL